MRLNQISNIPACAGRKDQKLRRGFTLVEILVVMGIVVIIGLAVGTFGRDIFWQNYKISQNLVIDAETKIALARLITELRRAQPASNGAYEIESASSTAIIFYSDIDNSGARARLHYWLDGTSFKRGVIKPTGQPYVYNQNNESVSVIVNNLSSTSTIFSYYNNSYDGTASSLALIPPIEIRNIRLIKINLLHLSSQVMLRNLKDNL